MKKKDAGDILCPICFCGVKTEITEERGGHIRSGTVTCSSCGRRYPVHEGVALLAVPDISWEPMIREVVSRIEIARTVSAGGFERDREESAEEETKETESVMTNLFEEAVSGLDIGKGTRVLDVGAGFCGNASYFAGLGADVVAQDVDLFHLRYPRFDDNEPPTAEGYPLHVKSREVYTDYFSRVLADVHRIPFRDSTFDVTYCRSTVHHLARPWSALREMARVTRPGGSLLLISEPTRSILDREITYLEDNFDYQEGLNEQAPLITTYTLPMMRYCRDVEVQYFNPGMKDRSQKLFRALRVRPERLFENGEKVGFKGSFKLLFAGTGVNISGKRSEKAIGKPPRARKLVGDVKDLILDGDSPAPKRPEDSPVSEPGNPYAIYSPLSLVSREQSEHLKRLHRECLKPGWYRTELELAGATGKEIRGWRDPEEGPGCSYRYSNRSATVYLRNDRSSDHLCFKMLGFPGEVGRAGGTIAVNGGSAQAFEVGAGWNRICCEKESGEPILQIELKNRLTYVPDEVLGNGDARELGVAVERVWQE